MSLYQNEAKYLVSDILGEPFDAPIIEQFLSHFPTQNELCQATAEEVKLVTGIGNANARKIMAALKFAQFLAIPPEPPTVIRKPEDVFNLIAPCLRYESREHFVCLFLNTKNRILAKETISVGTLDSAIVHPREVFRAAIKRGSASIICAHNHPSGDSTPSDQDIEITKRLIKSGDIIGINVLDHVVIGAGEYVSLKAKGFM